MKIALVHDYLREYGGAERVVEALHEIWPEAPLYTAFVDWDNLGNQRYRFKDWDIRTSWVQHNPLVKKFISPLRFLAPKIWSSFDLSDYDVVLSSSGWFMCRGVALNSLKLKVPFGKTQGKQSSLRPPAGGSGQAKLPLHICYIHHPPRNLYGYATGSDLQKYAVVRAYAAIVNFFLRHYDWETAQAVDFFIANSKETEKRVEKFYRRDSTVIYPPINSDLRLTINDLRNKTRKYYLSVGRLTWAKRVDLAAEACNSLKLPLKIVGTGREEKYLKSIAGPTVEFMGSVTDAELAGLYAGAKALIFSALDEDFGMVPVEAMAYGTPVIALGRGGVKETVVDGKTGVWFKEPTAESLIYAIDVFGKTKKDWGPACIRRAERFSKVRFKREIVRFIEDKINK